MKNKKIISRVLAIFAVLVLMVSMALPAFADEEEDNLAVWEEFYFTYNPNYGNLAFEEMYVNHFDDFSVIDARDFYLFSIVPDDISEFSMFGSISVFFNTNSQWDSEFSIGQGTGCVQIVRGDSVITGYFYELSCYANSNRELEYYFYDQGGNSVFCVRYYYDPDSRSLIFDSIYNDNGTYNDVDRLDVAFAVLDETLSYSDDFVRTIADGGSFVRLSPSTFYDGMYLSNRPDGVVPPSRTGMFGQIYYILYDAIYGSDAVIGTSQDFVLTQIATWMTYIVILLPLLVVAIFLWRVIAR